ncbi:nucleoside triphosphate pyrophosphohydrolase [Catalinimonas niigatensis]|uniref:nucleoside triphosphate pyrophosphohydrolase n=1 Tax=Catalinimonas niigatensis TaxID=1397264 RepID=UPI00266685D9|nr:nucleoside triphosphate pyrophosphohydrolase [Catalinimonas niigatensis]WPP48147.1 nucleoside triphosphate pyrophosphohydrolase [Catalinimonas niigatensis]
MTEHKQAQALEAFDRLLTIMEELRAQCPWDRKQTMESLRHLTIEETYELSDAILEGDMKEIQKELGDLALHIVFYSKIASEQQVFDISEVLNGICEKLIVRHPHIYGDVKAEDAATVERNWEQIKLKEKGNSKKTVLGGVPKSLPALIKAMRIQEKARGIGFDWEHKHQVWDKVEEEMEEFKEEEKMGDQEKMQDEYGDLLFSLVNYARFTGINPEEALERTNKKFIRRFNYLEEKVKSEGKNWDNMSLEEMDVYWNEAKKM